MPRAFSDDVTTELAKQDGQFPTFPMRFLSVYRTAGTLHFSDSEHTTPVVADPRVVQWGDVVVNHDPERIGTISQVRIELADHDGVLRAIIDSQEGIQSALAEISVVFNRPESVPPDTTAWDERVVIARGRLSKPTWSREQLVWSVNLVGLESWYTGEVGITLDGETWPDVRCSPSEGKSIPVVFGDPAVRIPAQLLDRPGQARLGNRATLTGVDDPSLNIHDPTILIDRTIAEGAFDDDDVTWDDTKTYYIGWPHNYETVTAHFTGVKDETKLLTVVTRGAILASGTSPGPFATGGLRYFMIDSADVPEYWISRAGHPIWWYVSGEWVMTVVTMWAFRGSNIIVGYEGQIVTTTGTPWKIGTWPGIVPKWPAGTPITEAGDWVFGANLVPSKEVIALEGRAEIRHPGGGDPEPLWFTYNESHYTVTLDDRQFNKKLGRHETDDRGVTTITLAQPPATLGFNDPYPYVTQRGIQRPDGEAATYAPDVVRSLFLDKFIGGGSADHIDDQQITDASTWLENNRAVRIAGHIEEQTALVELIERVAFEGTCPAVFDHGKLQCIPWPEFTDTESATITVHNCSGRANKISRRELKEQPTVARGAFRPYPIADQHFYLRESTDAITDFGRRTKEMEFLYIQKPTSVDLALTFWFRYFLNGQADMEIGDLWLPNLAIAPGAVVRVRWEPTVGAVLYDRKGIVSRLTHRLADLKRGRPDQLAYRMATQLYGYTVKAVSVTDFQCDAAQGDNPNPDPTFGRTTTQGETPPVASQEPPDSGSGS